MAEKPVKAAVKKTAAKKSTAKKTTATKKTVATKKSAAKKTVAAKKTAAKASTAKKAAAPAVAPEVAAAAAKVDRSALADKTRVHAVAKLLGFSSTDFVAFLAQRGLEKGVHSTLTAQQVSEILDDLAPAKKATAKKAVAAKKATAKKATATKAVAKNKETEPVQQAEEPAEAVAEVQEDSALRKRVAKNVENEISQIEAKVEAELTEKKPPRRSKRTASAKANNAEKAPKAAKGASEATGAVDIDDFFASLGVEVDRSYVDDEPVSPIPADEDQDSYEFAPIFLPPQGGEADEAGKGNRASRRRAARAQQQGQGHEWAEEEGFGEEPELIEEPKGIRGSTRIEAQRRRRAELREKGRGRKNIVSQAEFLARRESVERTMIVREKQRRDGADTVTQVGVLEDDLLVEHFVTSEAQASMIGNIYLGRVQNVLPSMEAAFIDIGQGRNGVLYAGEVNWKLMGLGGRSRKIEHALKSGDQVLVQVAKDPVGQKGARLTTQISLTGRYLVYVPGGRSAGISRKLPVPERKRLKDILDRVVPEDGGAIIRTAAENVPEKAIATDVNRLHELWLDINARARKAMGSKGAKPITMYEEPDLLIKVVRDVFNEDFSRLIVDGKRSFNTVNHYVQSMAPDLAERVERFDRSAHDGRDAFEVHRVDEQLHKALSRKVWLPSGGTLVIDRTEAMTVIDVNTGKFTGSGGNLEETVTRNNLEAAEEIVRQMRLRDLGGMIVVDFIDMVLPENQDLVLRRLKEALGRDRTRHQVSEVTSLGLVQMTRKRLGTGLIETFSTECTCCNGRGLVIHEYPVDENESLDPEQQRQPQQSGRGNKKAAQAAQASEVAAPQASIEELAAAVVMEDSPSEDESGADSQSQEQGSQRRRRRGTRGTQRGRAAKEAQSTQEQQAPEQGSEQTFEEALAEFEASPRRRRRTRGNSRSDHAPRREDFEAQTVDAAPDKSEGSDSGAEIKTASQARRRRRAVRKIAQQAEVGDGTAAAAATTTTEAVPSDAPAASTRTRRAVRRVVKSATGARADAAAQAAESTAHTESAGARGRRRVARRRNG